MKRFDLPALLRLYLVPVVASVAGAWPAACGEACGRGDGRDPRSDADLDFGGDQVQVGFGEPFSIEVRTTVPRDMRPEIHWTQVSGQPLVDIAVSESGFRFSAQTPALELGPDPLPWGVVPLSPRTRGAAVLEAEWRPKQGGPSLRRRVLVASASRSRGLPNVPLGQRLYLGGEGWHVAKSPAGSRAKVEHSRGLAVFTPDARGSFDLVDHRGRVLRMTAGRYDETPLDCGRSECHADLAASSAASPMTFALSRRFARHGASTPALQAARDDGATDDVTCALACHATGETGTHDGGFWDVATELDMMPALASAGDLAELPRSLRRLGGVGCLACHGPTALPEEDARWSILRTDVCAYCHDAPPRYGHVLSWKSSAMARADRDSSARSKKECITCHTAWGFLGWIEGAGTAGGAQAQRRPPEDVAANGIGCAACHAVHAKGGSASTPPHLVREVRLPPVLDNAPTAARLRSGPCLLCHAPTEKAPFAQASASAIWVGRGGVEPETGAAVTGAAPHLDVEGGCVGCHDAGPGDIERGANHAFRANRNRCRACHDAPPREEDSVRDEARSLFERLRALDIVGPSNLAAMAASGTDAIDARPLHAGTTLRVDFRSPLGRAAYDLSLVLEDRGAFIHNPRYAQTLINLAKSAIDRRSSSLGKRPRSAKGEQP